MRNLTILLFMLITLTGCENIVEPTEISALSIVRILAFDAAEDDDVIMSVLSGDVRAVSSKKEESQKPQENSGGESSSSDISLFSARDKTLARAERDIQKIYDKKIFWGHVSNFIFSEELIKNDIYRNLDYISSEPQFRMNANVYMTPEKASELIQKADESGYFLPDYLDDLMEIPQLTADTSRLTILDLVEKREKPLEAIAIPKVKMRENNGISIPEISGYGIIKEGQFQGYIDGDEAKGYNILTNKVDAMIIDIKIDDTLITLRQPLCNTKLKPVVENGSLKKIEISVKTDSNILEIKGGNTKLSDRIHDIEYEHEKALSGYVSSTLEKLKEYKSDFIGIASLYHMKHPLQYNTENWNDTLENLEFEIKIESVIKRSYDSREYDKGGK